MAHYRHEWTNAATGWAMRFDIVTYGTTISAAPIALGANTVASDELKQTNEFDELPFGLMNAPTLSVKLFYDNLPSDVQTALRTVMSGTGERNLFLLWTDRGANTWAVEFAGTEEKVAGFSTELDTSGVEVMILKLVDVLYHAALSLKPEVVFDANVYNTKNYDTVFEVATPDYSGSEIMSRLPAGFSARIRTIDEVAVIIRTALSQYLVSICTKTTNVSPAATATSADSSLRIGEAINTGVRFFKATSTYPRQKAAELTATTAHLISHIITATGETIGGLFAKADELSWAQEQSLLDVLKSLAETMCLKISWSPQYVGDVNGDYIIWLWDVACIFSNKRGDTTPATIDMATAVSLGTLQQGDGTLSRTEVRFSLTSANQDRNVTQVEYTTGRARAERSMNITPLIHNVPSVKDRVLLVIGVWDAFQWGLTQTNLICYDSDQADTQMDKAHEDTRVVVRGVANGGTATTFIDVNYSSDYPILFFSPQFEDYASMDVDPQRSIQHQAWINTAQRSSCLPYALAKTLFFAFSAPLQSTTSITSTVNINNIPSNLGSIHNLTGTRATIFPSLNWARACIVSISVDWIAGTSEVTYLMPDLSLFT